MTKSKGTIYAIHGLQRSGKGTIASVITKAHRDAKLIKFADIIKDMTDVLLDNAGYHDEKFRHECIESSRKEQQLKGFEGLSTRTVLQYAGSEFRSFNPNLWTDITEQRIRNLIKSGETSTIIIDDMRFPSEVNLVKKIKADYPDWTVKTIKVIRPGFNPEFSRSLTEPNDGITRIFNNEILQKEYAEKAIDRLMKDIDAYVADENIKKQLLANKSKDEVVNILMNTFKGSKKRQKDMKANKTKHSSENGLDSDMFDIVLPNNRDPKHLYALVNQYVL